MKRLIVMFFLAVLAVATMVGLRFVERNSRVELPDIRTIHEASGVPVRVERPERADLEEAIQLRGGLEGLVEMPAAFEVDGRLLELTPRVGDRVEKGQLIGRLDDLGQRAQVGAAEASLAIARATLEKARSGARPQEVQAAGARHDEEAAVLTVAQIEFDRAKTLRSKQAISELDFLRAGGAYHRAVARKEQSGQNLDLLKAGARREDLTIAEAQVKLAEAQLALQRLTLSKHVLVAPIDGVVTLRHVEPGQAIKNVPEPKEIVDVIQTDPILFVSDVSELFLPRLEKNAEITVSIDAYPGETFPARLHEVSPIADPRARTFTTKFAISNADLRLKLGMFCRARLSLRQSAAALTVPSHVLRRPAGLEAVDGAPPGCLPAHDKAGGSGPEAIVMVAENGLAAARFVRTGIVAGGRAEILSGLQEEEFVIVDGFEELKAGQKVDPGKPGTR